MKEQKTKKLLPKLSVCIPVYNGIKTIERAISSVLKIKNINFELVIIDNKSTDGTFEYIESISKTQDVIKLYRNKVNIGFALNYYECILKAKGEYITFCGADDIMEEAGVNLMIEFLDENSHLGIASGEIWIDSNNFFQKKYRSNFGFDKRVIYESGVEAATHWLLNSSISSIGGYFIRSKSMKNCTIKIPSDTFYPMLYLARSVCMSYAVANVPFVCLSQTFTSEILQMANKQYLNLQSAHNFLEIFDEIIFNFEVTKILNFEEIKDNINSQVIDSLTNNLISYATFGGYVNGINLIKIIYPRLIKSKNNFKFYFYSMVVVCTHPIILKNLLFIFRKNRSFLGKILKIK
jgi:glycosyltransferase involved in cell wall biosynthesis